MWICFDLASLLHLQFLKNSSLMLISDLIIDHLSHCSLASSAEIPSQRLPFFPGLTLLSFSCSMWYYCLFLFPTSPLLHLFLSFVHSVSSVVLLQRPLLSLTFYPRSSSRSIYFTWFIASFPLASIVCSILVKPRSVHLAPFSSELQTCIFSDRFIITMGFRLKMSLDNL